jgi:uncharacterized protein (DUF58 family)
VEPRILRQVFFLGTAGVCLLFGFALRAPALLAYPVGVFLLVVLARASAHRRLSRLRASRSVGSSAFEDDVVRVELTLENHGHAPVSLVEITDAFGPALADRKALLDAGPLRPRRRHRLAYRSACSRLWGVYAVGPLTLSVSDALGLFSPRRVLPDIRPFDLFPRVHPVGGLDRLGGRRSFAPSESTAARAGQSAAYLGVREFRSGDDLRRVHWPATARHAVPMVKEYELDLTPYFTLFLDLERRHRAGTGRKSTHEYVVRTGASLLASAARRGDTVQLVGEGRKPLYVPPGRGDLHLAFALDQLIRVRQDGELPLLDVVWREQAAVPRGSTAALLLGSVFVETESLEEVLGWMRSRGVRPLVVAVDMDSFLPIERHPRSRPEVEKQARRLREVAGRHGALVSIFTAEQDLPEELARPDWLEEA